MKNPFKRSSIASIETELANLATRRETLEARKAKATANLDAARSARKAALSGDPDADLASHTRGVQEAGDELETINSVLADITDQTDDAELRLAEAKDQDTRAKAAKELAATGARVNQAAADLDAAMKAVGKAYDALVAAVPETLKVFECTGTVTDLPPPRMIKSDDQFRIEEFRSYAGPVDFARIILAEAVARNCRGAFAYRYERGGFKFELGRIADPAVERPSFEAQDPAAMQERTAAQAAKALVTDRLQDRAEKIIAGEMSADLHDRPIPVAEMPKPVIPSVEVFALENFAFRIDERTAAHLVGKRWVRDIPQDAADIAVAAGVALRTDSPEGAEAFKEEQDRRKVSPVTGGGSSFLTLKMCHDLGVIRKADAADAAEDTDNVVPLAGEAA